MKLYKRIKQFRKKAYYEYWILTIKIRLYAVKYRHAYKMPYSEIY
ncbi:hypothetical protein [Seonamhaeicola sp. S2-3]|nr:hypothetical protein [Seonamhaeicola sp. S2-3]